MNNFQKKNPIKFQNVYQIYDVFNENRIQHRSKQTCGLGLYASRLAVNCQLSNLRSSFRSSKSVHTKKPHQMSYEKLSIIVYETELNAKLVVI